MARLNDIVRYCNDLLKTAEFSDYCPNGLQVEGQQEVSKLLTGVTASQALIDEAVKQKADAILVHHGYFWKGESPCITGMKYRRIRALIEHGVSLIAYHLPLDAHPELGNNAQLGRLLGFPDFAVHAEGREQGLLFYTQLQTPLLPEELNRRISNMLDRQPLHLSGGRSELVRIGWCSGGAQSWIEQAADLGLDAFISGEVSEQTTHIAAERGIDYFAAGHHATERYGVKALGNHLKERFSLSHVNVDLDNPV